MNREEAARVAAACGLKKLEPKHLDQFAASANSISALAEKLPTNLDWTEEPAHVLDLVGKGGFR